MKTEIEPDWKLIKEKISQEAIYLMGELSTADIGSSSHTYYQGRLDELARVRGFLDLHQILITN